MLVKAKSLGEHPQGTWRQPGETFEFDGKKPALWMEKTTKKKPDADKAQADADAAQKAIDDAKAAKDAEDKAEADKKAKEEADADALAKETADKLAAEGGEGEANGDGEEPKFKAIHRGAGKYDVFDQDLEVVEGGDNLDEADANALVEKLIAEAEAAPTE